MIAWVRAAPARFCAMRCTALTITHSFPASVIAYMVASAVWTRRVSLSECGRSERIVANTEIGNVNSVSGIRSQGGPTTPHVCRRTVYNLHLRPDAAFALARNDRESRARRSASWPPRCETRLEKRALDSRAAWQTRTRLQKDIVLAGPSSLAECLDFYHATTEFKGQRVSGICTPADAFRACRRHGFSRRKRGTGAFTGLLTTDGLGRRSSDAMPVK